MRGSLCSFVAVMTLSAPVLAQSSFTQLIGGPLGHDGIGLVQHGSGWLVGGRVHQAQGQRFAPVLFDCSSSGAVLGTNALPIPGTVFLQAMVPVATSGSWVCGSLFPEGGGSHRALVAKLSNSGTLLSYTATASSTDQQFLGIAALPDGGVVACGVVAGANGHDILLARFASDGTMLWSTVEEAATDQEAYAVAVDAQGIMLTGRQLNFGGKSDALFMRYSLEGTLIWSTSWGGIDEEEGRALITTNSGSCIMAGYTRSEGPMDAQGRRRRNLHLINIDANGDTVWTRTRGDILYDREAFAIAQAPNGDLLVAGTIGAAGLSDLLVARFSASGQFIWERRYDHGKEERLLGLLALADGFVASGWSFGPQGQRAILMRRNVNGD